ncbi:hypothetical protein [Hyphobacterium sp.]|uniref:hypothetical protein n=1 Tax=Hyphobacterium sp. TaxID=2004662 RepID=UPI003BAAE105
MRVILALAGALLAATGAAAQDRSEFTRFEDCEDRDPGDLAPYLQVCSTPFGFEVWLPYSEHSSAMAIGPNGLEAQFDERPEIGGLNMTIGPVMDWRFRSGEAEPYAGIIRYRGMTPVFDGEIGDFTGEVETNSNILVVLALRPEGEMSACHVAYIDAMEVPNANAVAHTIAASRARDFACAEDEILIVDAENPVRIMLRYPDED